MNNKLKYTDPKRKIGSQSEVPTIICENTNIIVNGYQQFIINKETKSIKYIAKVNKFSYLNTLMCELNGKYNCRSIVDIGCNSGLVSLIALNNNFQHIISLDHDPEYIDILRNVKKECNITKINESVFSFGDKIDKKFDVVFCGAIIHWIFSLTADFRNFDSILKYLIQLTNNFLVIEWISENDSAITSFNHIKRSKNDGDEEYNTINFEKSVKKFAKIVSTQIVEDKTRIVYVLQKI